MVWIIAYRIVDGKYEEVMSGSNILIDEEVDKVLPVAEHVARQSRKLYYDGEKLLVKEGETLLSLEELNAEQYQQDIENGIAVREPESGLVEPE